MHRSKQFTRGQSRLERIKGNFGNMTILLRVKFALCNSRLSPGSIDLTLNCTKQGEATNCDKST